MDKTQLLSVASILVLLFFALSEFQLVTFTSAQSFEIITIKPDGSVDPPTVPITQNGNVYTLTGNIVGRICVERFNIVIDGAGYTIQGNGNKRGIEIANPYNASIKKSYDVTVKNINIRGFEEGIDVFGYWGNIINGVVITGNNVTNNSIGIRFSSYYTYSNNTIIGNRITANTIGVDIQMAQEGGETSGNIIAENQIANNQIGMKFLWMYSGGGYKTNKMNNTVFYNNFISNSQNVVNAQDLLSPESVNIWDNGARGNYWNDYNGKDINADGVGDIPYHIDANNQDNYPLMYRFENYPPPIYPSPAPSPSSSPTPSLSPSPTPTSTPETQPKPFPMTLVVASVVATIVVVGAVVLVYFNKRKH
ncbi:hypothetical protein JXA31_05700 [Candidatus Bathyarchaeota archaeon]|nr:hypothetical protein [Candidatus Bathyarchaeota archaeon]